MYANFDTTLTVTFTNLQKRMGTKEYMPTSSKAVFEDAFQFPLLIKTKRQLSIFIPNDNVVDQLFRAIAHFSSF